MSTEPIWWVCKPCLAASHDDCNGGFSRTCNCAAIGHVTPDTRDPVTPLTAEERTDALSKIADELEAVADRHVDDAVIAASLRVDARWLRRIAALDAARQSDGAEAGRPEPGGEVPPRPWTSPALLQPWPDSAAWVQEVRDADGKLVFNRNWREQAAALRYLIRLVNWAALQAAPVSIDRERLTHIRGIASGEGGDEASRSDPQNALATIVIVCDEALSHAV